MDFTKTELRLAKLVREGKLTVSQALDKLQDNSDRTLVSSNMRHNLKRAERIRNTPIPYFSDDMVYILELVEKFTGRPLPVEYLLGEPCSDGYYFPSMESDT